MPVQIRRSEMVITVQTWECPMIPRWRVVGVETCCSFLTWMDGVSEGNEADVGKLVLSVKAGWFVGLRDVEKVEGSGNVPTRGLKMKGTRGR